MTFITKQTNYDEKGDHATIRKPFPTTPSHQPLPEEFEEKEGKQGVLQRIDNLLDEINDLKGKLNELS